MMMFGRGGTGGTSSSSSSSRTRRCEECGNQAKKDCVYMRCRTCCKSKGFECQTHVKSTWVPAYRRNMNIMSNINSTSSSSVTRAVHQQQLNLLHYHHSPKRLRTSTVHKHPTSSGLDEQYGEFPAEIRSTATFRCVRVSSMNDDNNKYAYQASVNIGGHQFKGILYDEGPDKNFDYINNDEIRLSVGDDHYHIHQPLDLDQQASTSNAHHVVHEENLLHSSSFPFNTFMPAGTQFFRDSKP
ncbi:hypothetical protein ACFE04_001770 [Oxalis oulophora]